MITDIVIYVVSWIIGLFAFFLPSWDVWPQSVHDFISYTAEHVAPLNFILPVDQGFAVSLFIIQFEFYFILYIVTRKIFNYLRGAGGL